MKQLYWCFEPLAVENIKKFVRLMTHLKSTRQIIKYKVIIFFRQYLFHIKFRFLHNFHIRVFEPITQMGHSSFFVFSSKIKCFIHWKLKLNLNHKYIDIGVDPGEPEIINNFVLLYLRAFLFIKYCMKLHDFYMIVG